MQYSLTVGDPSTKHTQCLVLGVFSRRRLSAPAQAADKASSGVLGKLLKKGDIDGEQGQFLMLYDLPGLSCERVLLVGCGKEREFTQATLKKVVTAMVAALDKGHSVNAVAYLPDLETSDGSLYRRVRESIEAAAEGRYRFDQMKGEAEPPKRPLTRLTLGLLQRREKTTVQLALKHGQAIANGVALAKDLGNLPGNVCTPSYLADQARELARRFRRLKVEVLKENDMKALGMGALLSVSRGSRQPAKLIVMRYNGGKRGAKPVVLVGKGLTFDAGGISLKPAQAMDEMKYDMCGGASVFGTLRACLELNLPINVIGVVPSSENLPDGDANKPGDIVTSMSGQTIEVLNTDAEGRLILCDALTYCERFEPASVIDIATLTGACVVALGKHASGLLSNNDSLAEEVLAAGEQSSDRAWRLPLWDDYQSLLDSNFADMANIGGRDAGAITAACFLSRYSKKFKWAHLDIAGTAWKTGTAKGATGRPVPLLTQLLLKRSGMSRS